MNNSILTLRPDVVVTVMEDGAVLLDLHTKFFYSVNSTGWAIVQLLEKGSSQKQAVDLCIAWGAQDDDANRIEAFFQVFLGDNLVTSEEGRPKDANIDFNGTWSPPAVEKHKEPLQRVMVSAFDPSLPLAE